MLDSLKKTYGGKKVFLTGHTGFKGAWLLKIFNLLGADVKGYALEPKTANDLYYLINGNSICKSVIEDLRNRSFLEKPKGDGSWINGGFFVCEPEVFEYISGDDSIFEKEPMESLAHDGKMQAFLHHGFWKPMDTIRDKMELEELWASNDKTPWKKW